MSGETTPSERAYFLGYVGTGDNRTYFAYVPSSASLVCDHGFHILGTLGGTVRILYGSRHTPPPGTRVEQVVRLPEGVTLHRHLDEYLKKGYPTGSVSTTVTSDDAIVTPDETAVPPSEHENPVSRRRDREIEV
jgi:hypothetical protein